MISPWDDVVARGRRVVLRRKRLRDGIDQYAWRSDEELARYDGTAPLRASFPEYFRSWSFDLRFTDVGCRSFAIEDEAGNHIGNVMYYNVDERRKEAELGISIGEKGRWSCGYGSDAIIAMARYIFSHTELQRLYLHTLDWNHRAQRCFQKAGLQVCGTAWRDGRCFVVMDVWRQQLEAGSQEYEAQNQRPAVGSGL